MSHTNKKKKKRWKKRKDASQRYSLFISGRAVAAKELIKNQAGHTGAEYTNSSETEPVCVGLGVFFNHSLNKGHKSTNYSLISSTLMQKYQIFHLSNNQVHHPLVHYFF